MTEQKKPDESEPLNKSETDKVAAEPKPQSKPGELSIEDLEGVSGGVHDQFSSHSKLQ